MEVIEQLKAWIVAFLVAFVGSGTFWFILKACASSIFKAITKKVNELEEQNKISKDQTEMYKQKTVALENKVNELLNKQEEVVTLFKKYIEVDQAKEEKATELLNDLFKDVNLQIGEEVVTDEEEQTN